eukprot:2026753-Alexandrium_andersonii.AAC.1
MAAVEVEEAVDRQARQRAGAKQGEARLRALCGRAPILLLGLVQREVGLPVLAACADCPAAAGGPATLAPDLLERAA